MASKRELLRDFAEQIKEVADFAKDDYINELFADIHEHFMTREEIANFTESDYGT